MNHEEKKKKRWEEASKWKEKAKMKRIKGLFVLES
jgi:hypothetical protein